MKSLQFKAFIRFVLSYLRVCVRTFRGICTTFTSCLKGCEYYIWFLDVNSWFTLCRVSSVPFGRADKNLSYVYMLNKNQKQMILHSTLHSL